MPTVSISSNTTEEYAARPLERPPTHPGATIKLAREALPGRVSIRDMAGAIGTSHTSLANVEKEAAEVTEEMDLRVSRYFGKPPGLYRQMQIARDMWFAERKLRPELAKIVPAERA